jgi:hypothetical protein
MENDLLAEPLDHSFNQWTKMERSARHARTLSYLLVIGLVVSTGLTAGLTVALAPKTHGVTVVPFTGRAALRHSEAGFAGYSFSVPAVHEASATVAVPTLYNGELGSASTWIGIQSRRYFFLQVGVLENSARTPKGPRAVYAPFWSDSALGFSAYTLHGEFLAHQGDQLRLSIKQTPSGWTLEFDDRTLGQRASVHTGFGSGVVFNQVIWNQEDPISLRNPLSHVQYPDLGVTRFTDLSVNSVMPHLGRDQARDMDVGGWGVVVPTTPHDDGFQTHLATGLDYRYLNLVAQYNEALDNFFSKIDDGTPGYVAFEKLQTIWTDQVFAALTLDKSWPATLRPDIGALMKAEHALEVRAGLAWDAAKLRSAKNILIGLERKVSAAASTIRDLLGLAPPNLIAGFVDLPAT